MNQIIIQIGNGRAPDSPIQPWIPGAQFMLLIRQCSKTPGEDMTSAIPRRSEGKPMRVLAWGFADSAN